MRAIHSGAKLMILAWCILILLTITPALTGCTTPTSPNAVAAQIEKQAQNLAQLCTDLLNRDRISSAQGAVCRDVVVEARRLGAEASLLAGATAEDRLTAASRLLAEFEAGLRAKEGR